MRRPAGAIVAAILLGLAALLGIPFTVFGIVFGLMGHVAPELPRTARASMIFGSIMELCGFVFCGCTAIGLFRLRPWARIAAIVLGGLSCFGCLMAGMGILLLRSTPGGLPATPNPAAVGMVLTGTAVTCFAVALLGVWWVVYFNLGSTRRAFAGQRPSPESAAVPDAIALAAAVPEPATPGSRIVLVVWSWLTLFSVLSLPMVLWMHTPLFFFGAILRGWAGTLTLLAFWAAEIYMALGIMRRWKPAWYLALFFQIYAVGYTATLLAPGVRARFSAYLHEAMSLPAYGVPSAAAFFNGRFYAFCLVLGLTMVVLFTWALIQRRDDYLRA